jgi:hypothetical protein
LGTFLKSLAWFGGFLFMAAWVTDLGVSALLDRSSACVGEFEVTRDIRTGKAACDLAIMGSSRAWVQISPMIIEDSLGVTAYNLGVDGHNFPLQRIRFATFRAHNPPPRWLILVIDMDGFVPGADVYNKEQFLPYMLWNSSLQEQMDGHAGFTWADHHIPMVRYAGKPQLLYEVMTTLLSTRHGPTYRTKGYRGMDRVWNKDLERVQCTHGSIMLTVDSNVVDQFKAFLAERAAEGTRTILVNPPQYLEGQRIYLNRKEVLDVYHSAARANGLPLLDYSDDPICLQQDLFYNSNHMNRKGSELFSRQLAHDLRLNMSERSP